MNRIARLSRVLVADVRAFLAAAVAAVAVVAMALPLAGCVPLEPHRYRLAKPGVVCDPGNAASADCRNAVVEHGSHYDLHFVEFDDQGLQYPDEKPEAAWGLSEAEIAEPRCDLQKADCLHPRAWAYQINNVVKQLTVTARDQPITLLVFIHGWKHDARTDDANVAAFRDLLGQMAAIEERRVAFEAAAGGARSANRKVVGLYVSWRGESIGIEGLDNLTFWSRKTAAMHVAEGSSRELFARLRGFKCTTNARKLPPERRDCNLPPQRDDPVKVILIGHSFGGLILYNSLAGSLIETMTRAFDASETESPRYWRFADLAVLVNPAFEAVRYTPLQRIAASSRYDRYEPPLLVTITSTTDTATGFWFKLGRLANTVFERTANDDEKTANSETVGHHAAYLTHRLEVNDEPGRCDRWQPLDPRRPLADQYDVLGRDLAIEYNNSQRFFRDSGSIDAKGRFGMRPKTPWARDFCGGVRLTTLTGTDPNSPVWNVSAIGDATLLPNHSDIMEPRFVGVIRQLYMDTIFLDHMVTATRSANVPP